MPSPCPSSRPLPPRRPLRGVAQSLSRTRLGPRAGGVLGPHWKTGGSSTQVRGTGPALEDWGDLTQVRGTGPALEDLGEINTGAGFRFLSKRPRIEAASPFEVKKNLWPCPLHASLSGKQAPAVFVLDITRGEVLRVGHGNTRGRSNPHTLFTFRPCAKPPALIA